MWTIMKKFNVLPTDPRFKALTESQISFIFANIVNDNEDIKRAKQGLDPLAFEDVAYDSTFDYDGDVDDFELVPEWLDVESFTKTVRDNAPKDETYERKIESLYADKDKVSETIDAGIAQRDKNLQRLYDEMDAKKKKASSTDDEDDLPVL
ncbi:hypothetical protein RND61_15060 [Streptomyces sp. TRM76323]|uniref:Tail assembly chaperone n=1 Tax=Streptomyces tamarix TaxID=3078565 RepID=A0ABU3QLQ3_9ACTN|nr:hypothetical protein [Streptomyces tamarix]MDT9683383.1 hypothetical protein [Streptomyces tamarix]